MKKWAIAVLVLLGGALLAMQYMMDKTAKGPASSASGGQGEPGGVPLPPSATGYITPEIPGSAYSSAAGDPDQLVLPNVPTDYKGECAGSSLAEIGATHGRYWGYLAKDTPFSYRDTQKMYDFMVDYIGCVAIARGNGGLCNSLPIEPPRGATQNRYDLRYNCRKKVNPVLFIAYMAGKNRSGDACRAMLAGWKMKTLAKISVTDLCEAAAKGPEAANAYLLKAVPKNKKKIERGPKGGGGQPDRPEMPDRVREPFPTSESSCGKDRECVNGAKMYQAMRSGDLSKCPHPTKPVGQSRDQDAIKGAPGGGSKKQAGGGSKKSPPKDSFCEAALSGSALPCETIVREMSGFYCAAVERAKKANGGYIGMTKEEIQTDLGRKTLARAQEESRRKEGEKIQAEINKKVKKMMGKE